MATCISHLLRLHMQIIPVEPTQETKSSTMGNYLQLQKIISLTPADAINATIEGH